MAIPQLLNDIIQVLLHLAPAASLVALVLAGISLRREGGTTFSIGGGFTKWMFWAVAVRNAGAAARMVLLVWSRDTDAVGWNWNRLAELVSVGCVEFRDEFHRGPDRNDARCLFRSARHPGHRLGGTSSAVVLAAMFLLGTQATYTLIAELQQRNAVRPGGRPRQPLELSGRHDHADRGRARDRRRHPELCYEAAGHAPGCGSPRHAVRFGNLEIGSFDGGIGRAMSFTNGILNLTNWAGNVILPTLAGLFFAIAILRFARSESYVGRDVWRFSLPHGFGSAARDGNLCLAASLERSRRVLDVAREPGRLDLQRADAGVCGLAGRRGRSAHGNRHARPSHRRMAEALRCSGTVLAFVGTCAAGGVLRRAWNGGNSSRRTRRWLLK